MPELPEVETTLRGIKPYLTGQKVASVTIREARLRWPVTPGLQVLLKGRCLKSLYRRSKYLLLVFAEGPPGALMIHLGMSGSLRLAKPSEALRKHDHVEVGFANGWSLRFHDPRRFGAILWVNGDPAEHKLLRHLGPEPLAEEFTGAYLYNTSRQRKLSIKQLIMDSKVVVGVGNIYANEALHRAGINPLRQSGNISLKRYRLLADSIKRVLAEAIEQGGTTLRDFVNGKGNPGYFKQRLQVYGRASQPCRKCQAPLIEVRLGQRSTVYCRACQR